MPALDADPGEEPRPSEEPSTGMETEDELAEDLTPSPSQSLAGKRPERPVTRGPGDDDDGDGMQTEDEIRSPRGRRRRPPLELAR